MFHTEQTRSGGVLAVSFEPCLDVGWAEAQVLANTESRGPITSATPAEDRGHGNPEVKGNVAKWSKADRSRRLLVDRHDRTAWRTAITDNATTWQGWRGGANYVMAKPFD